VNKTISLIAAAAAAVTAVPAAMAVPQAANAAVRVAVGVPGGGFYYGGRHYRNRYWRNNAWVYVDPFEPAYGYGEPAYGYAEPGYGYNYAPGPSVGIYYDGGRRYNNRARECHYNPNRGRVCKYRYW
jgi:hypothetical protein